MVKQFVKKMLRYTFAYLAFKDDVKIVVSSNGRAGSTMLFNAIADGFVKKKFHVNASTTIGYLLKKICIENVNRMDDLVGEVSVICKVHDVYKEIDGGDNYKYIFVYSDPLDAAISVDIIVEKEGIEWFKLHQFHLNANGDYSDLYKKDVLNYENQLRSWMGNANNNVLCVEYEDLWASVDMISEFLGFSIQLPEKRQRKRKTLISDIDHDLFDDLRSVKNRLKKEYLNIRNR